MEAFGGMISVGGYTYGNANEWNKGTEIGERMVPFFGGVYTRFDMTVANNWDINLQYNNDPFFDSTSLHDLPTEWVAVDAVMFLIDLNNQ